MMASHSVRYAFSSVLLICGTAALAQRTATPQPVTEAQRPLVQIPPKPNADPVADARAAAAAGRFGLFAGISWHRSLPPGAVCMTPSGKVPEVLANTQWGDELTPEIAATQAYASAYNRALVDQPSYRDADLCRASMPADDVRRWRLDGPKSPARLVTTPPRNLHEAARRGTVAEVARFLSSSRVDAFDSLGLTSLTWAAARGNQPVVDYLLARHADPWITKGGSNEGAVYWAAATGRSAIFEQLVHTAPPPYGLWTGNLLRAAVLSGDTTIVQHMLAERHQPYEYAGDLAPLSTLGLALADKPRPQADYLLVQAIYLLAQAIGGPGEESLDYVKLALAHGADPNAMSSGPPETALGMAASGIGRSSYQAVQLLLEAGADPNRMSWDRRPIWVAARHIALDKPSNEVNDRAKAIFLLLARKGADVTLPNADGRAPIWLMLFPAKYAPEELDAGSVTPDLLRFFVAHGLDVNARWNGKRVLAEVEAQAGKDSPLATALRSCGARQ